MNRKHSMYVDSTSNSRPPPTAYSHPSSSSATAANHRSHIAASNRNINKMSSSSMCFDSSNFPNFATLSSSNLKRNYSEGENLRLNSKQQQQQQQQTKQHQSCNSKNSSHQNGDVQQEWEQVNIC